MSDTAEATQESAEDQSGPKQLREKLSKTEQELEETRKLLNKQRMQLLESAFGQVGLDPTKGLGKAVAEKFDGDPTADAVRQFAIEEYSWEPPETGQENPLAPSVSQAQGRVSQATQTADSVPQLEIDHRIAEAEQRGDFATTMALKLEKFRTAQGI